MSARHLTLGGAGLVGVALLALPLLWRGSVAASGKTSDRELLELMLGSGTGTSQFSNQVYGRTHLPELFWEMAPPTAAVALVEANCDQRWRSQMHTGIPNVVKLHPPQDGEVGLRWTESFCMALDARIGLSVLKYSQGASSLSFSSVRVSGEASGPDMEAARVQTRSINLTPDEARHLYETIWFLGHVQYDNPHPSGMSSTADGTADFWVQPLVTDFAATIYSGDLPARYGGEFDNHLYATFVDFIFDRLLKRKGVDLKTPTAVIGTPRYLDADSEFVDTHRHPPKSDAGETVAWVDRMLAILQRRPPNPLLADILKVLVPDEEPLRYPDTRIDEALFAMVRPLAEPGKDFRANPTASEAGYCARALAGRDRIELFPILLKALQQEFDDIDTSELLGCAATLTIRHPELRPELQALIADRLNKLDARSDKMEIFIDAAWRGEFFELKPRIKELATATPDEDERVPSEGVSWYQWRRTGRYQQARRVVVAWSEKDPLTRLKLNLLVEAASRHFGPPTAFLRRDFDTLSSDDRAVIRKFVEWLDYQQVGLEAIRWSVWSVREALGIPRD